MVSTSGRAGVEIAPDTAVLAADFAALGDRRRSTGMSLALTVLASIALVAALYLARAFFVPLLIGILASYALRPVVDWLEAHYLPRPAGAALALVALVGSLSWVGYSLSDDAAAMIEKLPQAAHRLRQEMSVSRASGKTPLQNMQEAANEIQGATAEAAPSRSARRSRRRTRRAIPRRDR
jgi:predicted PurR-regulated permease PerM